MFINPKIAISEGWVTGLVNEEVQVQPNALDFTLDRLFTIQSHNTFHISEDGKQMRGGSELHPVTDTRQPENPSYWRIEANSVYDGMSNMHVTLPEGVAALLIIRSTFNRNGIFLTSGIYDSLFRGNIGFVIHNRSGLAYVTPGTRIGQIVFVASDNAGTYAGGYNTSDGQHWSETD